MDWIHVPLSDYSGNLYIGNIDTAMNHEFFKEYQITYVISLDDSKEQDRIRFAKFHQIHLFNRYFEDLESPENEPNVRLISIDVSHLLHRCLQYGNTYVHCQAGINRSPFCVATFLISYQQKKPQEAIDLLKYLNKTYRKLPCLYNTLFLKILGGTNDQSETFKIFRR